MDFVVALAQQIMTESNISPQDIVGVMRRRHDDDPIWDRIRARAQEMNPAVLGLICASVLGCYGSQGETGVRLYDVHHGAYLGMYESGIDLLVTVATSALIAHMVDLTGLDWIEEPITSST